MGEIHTEYKSFAQLAALKTFKLGKRAGYKRTMTVSPAVDKMVDDVVCVNLTVENSKLADIINWLRSEIGWDGRAPAGFDTRRKSWGAARSNFWADGSNAVVQGHDDHCGCTILRLFFPPELKDKAMLLKLTHINA